MREASVGVAVHFMHKNIANIAAFPYFNNEMKETVVAVWLLYKKFAFLGQKTAESSRPRKITVIDGKMGLNTLGLI